MDNETNGDEQNTEELIEADAAQNDATQDESQGTQDSADVTTFMEFTGSNDRNSAQQYLNAFGGVEQAVDAFLSGLLPQPMLFGGNENLDTVFVHSEGTTEDLPPMEALLRAAEALTAGNPPREGSASTRRLHELTSRLLRISTRGGLNEFSLSSEGSGRSFGLSAFDADRVLPENPEDYQRFDDPERIIERIEYFQKDSIAFRDKIHEVGNLALHSKATVELLIDLNVFGSILPDAYSDSAVKCNAKAVIRSVQVFEAATRSVLTGMILAKSTCGRWFIPPRRSMQTLGGRSLRTQMIDIFIKKILPESNVAKLEHIWLSEDFDPSWRDRTTESEVLSLSLSEGCSIPFLKFLVSCINGCRANVNPEKDRVGKLDSPLVLAAKANNVDESTVIADPDYSEEDEENNARKLTKLEVREIWSNRAVEILLDHGASVDEVNMTEIEEDEDMTSSAKRLILDEKNGVRISQRKLNLAKCGETFEDEVKSSFLEDILPNFIHIILTRVTDLNSDVAACRSLDFIYICFAIIRKTAENPDEVFERFLSFRNGDTFRKLVALYQTVLSQESDLSLLKLHCGMILLPLLGCADMFNDDFNFRFKEKIPDDSLEILSSSSSFFQQQLSVKLHRFGIMFHLFRVRGTSNASFFKHAEFIQKLTDLHLAAAGLGDSNRNSTDMCLKNPETEGVCNKLSEGDVKGLHDLAGLLQIEPVPPSVTSAVSIFEGITNFEFRQARITQCLQQFFLANSKHVEVFFQVFSPPMSNIALHQNEHAKDEQLVLNVDEIAEPNANSEQVLEAPISVGEDMVTASSNVSAGDLHRDGSTLNLKTNSLIQNNESNVENNLLFRLMTFIQGVVTEESINFFPVIEHFFSNGTSSRVPAAQGSGQSVKNLVKTLQLTLQDAESRKGEFLVVPLLPITPLIELQNQILRTATIGNEEYIRFCKDIVGCKIKLRAQGSNDEFDTCLLMDFDQSTNAHLIRTIVDERPLGCKWLNLALFDYECLEKVYVLEGKNEERPNSHFVKLMDNRSPSSDSSRNKFKVDDTVAVWFPGGYSFDELCDLDDSSFNKSEENDLKVPSSSKCGWYQAQIKSVDNAESGPVTYTVEYSQLGHQQDCIIRVGDIVKLKAETLARFPKFSADDEAKVLFLKSGHLITDAFKKKIFAVTEVEKQVTHIPTKPSCGVLESSVQEHRLRNIEQIYVENERHQFSVYLKPVSLIPKNEHESVSEEHFSLHQRIEARYAGKSRWYKGCIARCNIDGSYDVSYDDADTERHVNADLIIPLSGKGAKLSKKKPQILHDSFSRLFHTNARKLLFHVLRQEDPDLQLLPQHNFVTRGFAHQPAFDEAFATSMKQQKMGVFARFQTINQATTLAAGVTKLGSAELGIGFQLRVIIQIEDDKTAEPAVMDEIIRLFAQQERAQWKGSNARLMERLKRQVALKGELQELSKGQRVQVLVEVFDSLEQKNSIRWVSGTVLGDDIKNVGKIVCVLDDGTVIGAVSKTDVRVGAKAGTALKFQSAERHKASSPTKQIASPVRQPRRQGNLRKRMSAGQQLEFGDASSSMHTHASRFSHGERVDEMLLGRSLPASATLNISTQDANEQEEDHLELLTSDFAALGGLGSPEAENTDEEDHHDNPLEVAKPENSPGPVELTRRFTAFGDSMSYKHINISKSIPHPLSSRNSFEVDTFGRMELDFAAENNTSQEDYFKRPPRIWVEFSATRGGKQFSLFTLEKTAEVSVFQMLYNLFHSSKKAKECIGWKSEYELRYEIKVSFDEHEITEKRKPDIPVFSTETLEVTLAHVRNEVQNSCNVPNDNDESVVSGLFLLKVIHGSLVKSSQSVSGAFSNSLPWRNTFLCQNLKEQLNDTLSVGTRCFPDWPSGLCSSFKFLFKSTLREDLVRSLFLGVSRAVSFLQDSTPGYMSKKRRLAQATLELSSLFSGANPDILRFEQLQQICDRLDEQLKQTEAENFIGKLNEDLVKVSRATILYDSEQILEEHKASRSRMIVQFLGENSSGDGVTTDFYTTIANELQKKGNNALVPLFVDLDRSNPVTNQETEDDSAVDEIKVSSEGLFIQPLLPLGQRSEDSLVLSADRYVQGRIRNRKVVKRYKFLGRLFGKAFLDGHHLPLPLSLAFFVALKRKFFAINSTTQYLFGNEILDQIEGFELQEGQSSFHGLVYTLSQLMEENKVDKVAKLLNELGLCFVDISQPAFDLELKSKDETIVESETQQPIKERFELEESKEKDIKPSDTLKMCQEELNDQDDFDRFATEASENGCSQKEIEGKLIESGATKIQVWKALHSSQHIRNKMTLERLAKAPSATTENERRRLCNAELVINGAEKEVTIANVDEYLEVIKHWWLNGGVESQIAAFLQGMKDVLGDEGTTALLKTFSAIELRKILCGKQEIKWDDEDPLLGLIVPMGKFHKSSKAIKLLVNVLKMMSMKERSQFLNFATAQPRIPLSGLPKIKVYPPLMEKVNGLIIGFGMPLLTVKNEIDTFETEMKKFLPKLFKKGDAVAAKHGAAKAVVESWDPKSRTLMFTSSSQQQQEAAWFQAGQLIQVNSASEDLPIVLRNFKAELAVKKVVETPSAVQCEPYLRPKATTCAKTIYLPEGYKDEEHMLNIFREAFEDARLGGIHD